MKLRLLSKSEISKAKSTEKAREVEQGVQLARRVDKLREIQAQEEASLQQFRKKTLANIYEETGKADRERQAIQDEVEKLKKEREELKKPLTKEWEEVKREREQVNAKADELYNLSKKVERTLAGLAERERGITAKEHTIKEWQVSANNLLQEANNDRVLARSLLENARKEKDSAILLRTEIEQELEKKRLQAEVTEKRQSDRDKAQDERERELNARESRLIDREGVVQRNINRLKYHYGSPNIVSKR